MSLPGVPVNSLAVGVIVVTSIEIGTVTAVVPPRAVIRHCTVATSVDVVIIVKRREGIVSMACQGVTYNIMKTQSVS